MSECRVCSAITDQAFMCRPCASEVTRDLGDMRALLKALSDVCTGQTRVYRANGKPTDDAERHVDPEGHLDPFLRSPHGRTALRPTALMVNLEARELLWTAGNTLSTWARVLADSRGVLIPADWLTWMTDVSPAFRFSEEAAQVHDEITWLHRRLVKAVDRSPSARWAGPCHANAGRLAEAFDDQIVGGRCQRDLYAWDGKLEIRCDGYRTADDEDRGCGAEFSVADRREWLQDSTRAALVTVDELFEAMPQTWPDLLIPPRGVVQSWVRDGRLVPHGVSKAGEPLYLGSDLLERIEAYRPHKWAPRPGRMSA